MATVKQSDEMLTALLEINQIVKCAVIDVAKRRAILAANTAYTGATETAALINPKLDTITSSLAAAEAAFQSAGSYLVRLPGADGNYSP